VSVVAVRLQRCRDIGTLPSAEQAVVLVEHCRHARYVWNLAVEQQLHWQPGRRAP
jgi:putative transposase